MNLYCQEDKFWVRPLNFMDIAVHIPTQNMAALKWLSDGLNSEIDSDGIPSNTAVIDNDALWLKYPNSLTYFQTLIKLISGRCLLGDQITVPASLIINDEVKNGLTTKFDELYLYNEDKKFYAYMQRVEGQRSRRER